MKKLLLIILVSLFLAPLTVQAISPAFLHQIVDGVDSSDNWRKCELTVNASKVPSDQTNFPILLTEDTIPSESLDKDGSYPVDDGGGNMQFWSTKAGGTRYSCDPVTFTTDNNPANGIAEIHVKVPSVNGTTNTTFWMWYAKSGETQPAANASYGSESVWDNNFKLVQHMNEDPSGSAPQMIDSTSNDNDGTSNGTMTSGDLVNGKVGKGLDFEGSDDVIHGVVTGLTNLVGTVSVWIYPHGEGEGSQGRITNFMPVSGWDSFFFDPSGTNCLKIAVSDGSNENVRIGTNNDITLNVWNHVAYSYNGGAGASNIKIYVNGVEVSYTTTTGTQSVSAAPANFFIGANDIGGAYSFDGIIDEKRKSNSVRSTNWIQIEYNNQNDPSTFVTVGTPE